MLPNGTTRWPAACPCEFRAVLGTTRFIRARRKRPGGAAEIRRVRDDNGAPRDPRPRCEHSRPRPNADVIQDKLGDPHARLYFWCYLSLAMRSAGAMNDLREQLGELLLEVAIDRHFQCRTICLHLQTRWRSDHICVTVPLEGLQAHQRRNRGYHYA
jgi:hypothetical protein